MTAAISTPDAWLAHVDKALNELIATNLLGADPNETRAEQLSGWANSLADMAATEAPNMAPYTIRTLFGLLTVAVDRLASNPASDKPPVPPRVGQVLAHRSIQRADGTR